MRYSCPYRNFCKLCTTSVPQYPGCGESFRIPGRDFYEMFAAVAQYPGYGYDLVTYPGAGTGTGTTFQFLTGTPVSSAILHTRIWTFLKFCNTKNSCTLYNINFESFTSLATPTSPLVLSLLAFSTLACAQSPPQSRLAAQNQQVWITLAYNIVNQSLRRLHRHASKHATKCRKPLTRRVSYDAANPSCDTPNSFTALGAWCKKGLHAPSRHYS